MLDFHSNTPEDKRVRTGKIFQEDNGEDIFDSINKKLELLTRNNKPVEESYQRMQNIWNRNDLHPAEKVKRYTQELDNFLRRRREVENRVQPVKSMRLPTEIPEQSSYPKNPDLIKDMKPLIDLDQNTLKSPAKSELLRGSEDKSDDNLPLSQYLKKSRINKHKRSLKPLLDLKPSENIMELKPSMHLDSSQSTVEESDDDISLAQYIKKPRRHIRKKEGKSNASKDIKLDSFADERDWSKVKADRSGYRNKWLSSTE